MGGIRAKTISELMSMEFEPVVIEDGEYYTIIHDEKQYDIPKKRLKTSHDILRWVHHLSGKVWVTGQMINEFIEKAAENIKVKIY